MYTYIHTYIWEFEASPVIFCSVIEIFRNERGEGTLDCVGVTWRDTTVLWSETKA